MTVVDLTPELLLDETRFAPLAEGVAHEAVNARTPAERTAALEQLTSLRRARLAVVVAACAAAAPDRLAVGVWRASAALTGEQLDELAACVSAAAQPEGAAA